MFFYVGKAFCLRGGEEQRALKKSQLVCSYDPDCYTYVESRSKNKSGSNQKAANKIVPVYASPESGPQCIVYLLYIYLSKLPQGAKAPDTFYLWPVRKIPSNPVP